MSGPWGGATSTADAERAFTDYPTPQPTPSIGVLVTVEQLAGQLLTHLQALEDRLCGMSPKAAGGINAAAPPVSGLLPNLIATARGIETLLNRAASVLDRIEKAVG